MRSTRAAITGAGLITPLGDDLARLMESLREGQSALTQQGAGSLMVPNFEASRYANVRGMRAYNRTTQLGICAATLALSDARLGSDQVPSEQFGLVMASTHGHVDTLVEYDFGLVTKGMERTNPALMPLAIGSAPGSASALAFRMRGCSVTLSVGAAGGLEALGFAARMVESGRLRACLVVGAFAPLAGHSLGCDANLSDHHGARVFDAESRGMVLAEAACALVVEPLTAARERAANVHGVVLGHAAGFHPSPETLGMSLADSAQRALTRAELSPADVALISSGANGLPSDDEAHAHALCAMFYASSPKPPALIAPKANLGESMDAAGLLQVLVGLSALRSGVAPAIAGLSTPRVPGPRYTQRSARIERGALLTTASSRTGSTSALVLAADA
ncbi:MAG: beta-ketoacyl synthase N-terminal-like domain-containing protein [Myxococcales bacterium]